MTPAQPQRCAWLTLHPQKPTLEEACRRAHSFASRFPLLYRWRVTLLSITVCLAPLCALAFMTGATFLFPWAFRESGFLKPLYAEPLLRWATISAVFAGTIPIVAFYAAGLLRALTVRLPEPGGVRLEEAQAPRLFRSLAEMSRSLGAPAIEELRVSPDRVLEIRHEPCGGLGVFGRARTILVMGLPLAEEVSPQHFRALVAHEVAHLATHKRRFGGRVHGLRRRLAALRQAAKASALEGGYWSRLPDESLLETLDAQAGRLAATTFPAVRQHEAEADAIAAAIAGREFAVSALVRQRLAGHAVSHHFQAECMRLAESLPEAPADLFDRRAAAACGGFTEAQINAWLRAELEVKDNLTESHPPLWDRIRLLGFRLENMTDLRDLMEQAQPQRELGETAARFFLGDAAESLRAQFFREWASRQAGDWKKRFSVYESLRATAADWETGSSTPGDDPGALWQIAVAVGNTRSWRAALPLAHRILEIAPDHADANLLSGQILIEDGNRTGIDALERAMKSDSRVVPVACRLAARFLEGRGERDAAADYQKRCEERHKQEQETARERGHARASDNFSTANCPAATAEVLRRAVERQSSMLRAAYLMRKQAPDEERGPLYVLGVERRIFPWENAARANGLLLERIMRFPGIPSDILVCVVTRANRALLEKWKGVPGAVLFPSASSHGAVAPASEDQASNLLRETPHRALPARSTPAAAE